MAEALMLISWMIGGAAIALSGDTPADRRWTTVPVAMAFGPLWLSIATNQRAVARSSHRGPGGDGGPLAGTGRR